MSQSSSNLHYRKGYRNPVQMDTEANIKNLLIFNGKPESYLVWRTRFLSYLETKKVKVNPEESSSEETARNKNNMYRELIMHMDDETLQSIISLGTTDGYEVWNHLEKTYGQIKTPQILSLWRSFLDSKLEPGETIPIFLNRLDVTIYKLQSVSEMISENLKIAVVLRALPDNFKAFIAAVQFQELDYAQLKNKLIETALSEVQSTSSSNDVFLAAKTQQMSFRSQKKMFQKFDKPKFKPCENCGRTNHPTERCFAKGGAFYKGPRKNFVSGFTSSVFSTKTSQNSENDVNVYIDSGCSKHILFDKRHFEEIQYFMEDNFVINADNSSQRVVGFGRAKLDLLDDKGKQFTLQLGEVLYVPEFKFNLLSLSNLTKHGNTFIFNEKHPVWKTMHTTYPLHYRQDLYFMKIEKKEETVLLALDTWHQRFGHADQNMLLKLNSSKSVKGLTIKNSGVEQCDTCVQNKFTVLPLENQREVSQKQLELVYSDICGPFPKSCNGNIYIVSFIDDYSKFARLYFMKQKSEVFQKFQQFVTECSPRKINTLRSDNGLEYKSKEFQNFCTSNGIKQTFTSPHTPQQNGVSERYWRTILNMTRSILFAAKLSDKFWVRAADTACYIRNRSISRNNIQKTPYELFFGKVPDVSHLRIFGTIAYYKDMYRSSKLQPKAKAGIFCGYDSCSKSYIVYNPETNKFVTTRNVRFNESKFFQLKNNEESTLISKTIASLCGPINDEANNVPDEIEVKNSLESIASSTNVPAEGNLVTSINVTCDQTSSTRNPLSQSPSLLDNHANPEREETTPARKRNPIERYGNPIVLADTIDDNDLDDLFAFKINDNLATVPKTFKEAINSTEKDEWNQAMMNELESLDKLKVWKVVPRPKEKSVVGGKWVFCKKMNPDGSVNKFKARYVAKGFSQVHGENAFRNFCAHGQPTINSCTYCVRC